MGKHSKPRRHQVMPPRGMVEIADIRTGQRHLLTPDAAAAGQQTTDRRYHALCGTEILPAALVDPGTGLLLAVPVHPHPHPTRRQMISNKAALNHSDNRVPSRCGVVRCDAGPRV
jgi:hypothetical protein